MLVDYEIGILTVMIRKKTLLLMNKIFEEKLGQAILEIIEEHHIGSDENRDNNIKESVTE